MTTETSVFQSAIELPTLSDTGILAIAMGKSRAVDAIARRMKAAQEAAMLEKVENVWGQCE